MLAYNIEPPHIEALEIGFGEKPPQQRQPGCLDNGQLIVAEVIVKSVVVPLHALHSFGDELPHLMCGC